MIETPGAFRYIGYLRSRWRFVAVSCLTAVLLAGGISLLLPRQYTATARIVIEPPPGADPRSTLAVSQIYLDSLRTYEQFADNDILFQKAVDRFQLRSLTGPKPIEALKKQVLQIALLRNTRILEIGVTLPDPRRAQALAQFIAEETVALSNSLNKSGDTEPLQELDREAREARERLDRVEADWSRLVKPGADSNSLARFEQLEAERAAQASLAAIETRRRELRNDSGFRGEQLTIIDPGVVPERPSAPHTSLNVAAALLLGLLFPLVYLAVEMNLHEQRVLDALARHE